MDMSKLPNVKLLRDDMRQKGWCIDAYHFSYNNREYITIFEDFKAIKEAKKEKITESARYIIAVITFIDRKNPNRILTVNANTTGFLNVDTPAFREFFHIRPYDKGVIFWIGFYELFNYSTPNVFCKISEEDKYHVVRKLNKRDQDTDESFYCYKMVHNPINNRTGNPKQRSIYNDNKTRLLRDALYLQFGHDCSISFYYSDRPEMNKTDEEIIANFARQQKIHPDRK